MQRLLLIILLTPFSLMGLTQNRTIDSLVNNLNTQKIDSNIFKTYIQLGKIYSDSVYDKSLFYYKEALTVAERSSDRKKVGYTYGLIGNIFYKKGEFTIALENYNNALMIYEHLRYKTGIGEQLNDIGLIYKTWGKYDKALDNFLKALKIFDEIGDEVYSAMEYNNIGSIYYYRSDYDKSIVYFKKNLDVNKKYKIPRSIAGAANNIASAYMDQGKFDEAIDYYILSMRIYDSLGIKVGVAIIKDNIGTLYLRKKQYNDALLYNSEASRIFEEIGSQSRLCTSLQSVGLAYSKLNQPDNAITYLNRSLDIALRLKQQETKKDVYETLSDVYTQLKQFDRALSFYKLFVEIKDSLFNSETISKIETIQAEYESQKKEKNLAEVNQKLHTQKVLGLLSGGAIILFLFLTVLTIRQNQQKKKAIKIAEKQANNLYQIISRTNQNLFLSQNANIEISSTFAKFWHISTNKENGCSYIPFLKDSYIFIAFLSKGKSSDNEAIINLAILDFFFSLKNLIFSPSIKEQFNNFIAKEVTWQNAFNEEQLMNIDFWSYNKATKQQLFCGAVSAFHVDNNNQITDLSKKSNTWLKIDKGNRLFFCTSNSLNSFTLNENEYVQSYISKTIAKSIDLTFDEQKELLSNSLDLLEAGNEDHLNISIFGYLF